MASTALTARSGIALAALALATLSGAAAAQTQAWNYKSYIKDAASGQYKKDRFVTATIYLEEKNGKAMFHMVNSGRGDPCFNHNELPAEVERSADSIAIVVKPELAGCEPFRYVIRADGSGGTRYNRRSERWVPDGFDHDLTPKQP